MVFPETTHLVTLAGNPVLAGDSAKRVKQILVGDRNNTFLFASRLGELEALRFVALAGTDRESPHFRIQQTQNKGGIRSSAWEAGHQLGLKIAVDLFFVGRTDKVETMAGPRKI